MTSLGLSVRDTEVHRRHTSDEEPDRIQLVDRGNLFVVDLDGTPEQINRLAEDVAEAAGLRISRAGGVKLYLELSTAHLPAALRSKKTLNAIDGMIAEDRTYGFMVWVPDDPKDHHADYDALPPDEVMAILLYARRLACDWIVFDPDGDRVSDLPAWED